MYDTLGWVLGFYRCDVRALTPALTPYSHSMPGILRHVSSADVWPVFDPGPCAIADTDRCQPGPLARWPILRCVIGEGLRDATRQKNQRAREIHDAGCHASPPPGAQAQVATYIQVAIILEMARSRSDMLLSYCGEASHLWPVLAVSSYCMPWVNRP